MLKLSCLRRGLSGSASAAKVVAVLYPDPSHGYPPPYARSSIPSIQRYADGSTPPSPSGLDYTPGELLGCVSGELGLRSFLEAAGHTLVVTSDKEGDDCQFERELVDADYVISQPFFPAYMSRKRIEMASRLKACITAGIGSDHIDLAAAAEHKVDVAEITFSNSISVAEHVVLTMLALVRNFTHAHRVAQSGGWNIADISSRAYDIEGMQVGTVAAGRIGVAVMRRLKPFGVGLHYTDRHRLSAELEAELGATFWPSWQEMAPHLDVLALNCPLHAETEHMINAISLRLLKRGSYLINTARAKLCDTDAVVSALETGHLAGYGGDVWFPQPPDPLHPWRSMPFNAMVPHTSGTTLSAQARYAAGVREILECLLAGKPIRPSYQIVTDGKLAGAGAYAYTLPKDKGASLTAGSTRHS